MCARALALAAAAAAVAAAVASPSLGLREEVVLDQPAAGAAPLFHAGWAAPVWVDAAEFPGVRRVAAQLCEDLERVGGVRPALTTEPVEGECAIIVGTLERSTVLRQLADQGRLSVADLTGRWEAFSIATVENPRPGLRRALVIAGSDKRGAIYGAYELAEQLGVSPWSWWADVPPARRTAAYARPGRFFSGEPVVRYRGIFLNNEAPCLTGWAAERFGGLNSRFYGRLFDLLLRLRANYLWPAMWNNAFNEDDPENPRLADEYGIVMGTSHHEPMMRAHQEWTKRREQYGNGKWNYASNGEALQRFFREGISRNRRYENLVTVGLRGDGDEGMASTGSVATDLALLQRIFTDQRRILGEELQTDPATVPQLWALFTEVQQFYEQGLRPPDDVTLLWTDDNVGNLRRLPTAEERTRRGGAGIYYHFDMHGGPFSYQWINTCPLPKIAEQLHLAAEYGATRVWIVNVGDLKPLEIPTEFFLRFAWNPAAWPRESIADYTRRWAARDFGSAPAGEIAAVVDAYTKMNGWRKPELVKPETFSLLNFREAERVEAAWTDLVARAERIDRALRPEQRDAFYQLVLHPVQASALVARLNILAGRNQLFAKQGRAATNRVAAEVRELFRADRRLSDVYNHELAGGKWNHLMDQTHLGQSGWEPPVVDVMPAVAELLPPDDDRYGVAIEGSPETWPDHFGEAVLPAFDSLQPRRSFLEVFGIGTRPFTVTVAAQAPWVVVVPDDSAGPDRRYWIDIDWARAPEGMSRGEILVTGARGAVRVQVPATKASPAQRSAAAGRFASLTGPIAISAAAASDRTAVDGVRWENVPGYGRGDGAVTVYPVTAASVLPPARAPELAYAVSLPRDGNYEVTLVLGPVMDFVPGRGMRIAVGFDDGPLRVLDLFADRDAETFLGRNWLRQTARDGVRYLRATHAGLRAGPHVLRVAMVDPAVVVEKLIVGDRPIPESYFGPPEHDLVR